MEVIDHPYFSDIRRTMSRIINKVKLFPNDNEEAQRIASELSSLLQKYHFEIADKEYDLAIAIGGDGAFLRMVKQTAFNSNVYYIGINCGTLGFLQEIKPGEMNQFIDRVNSDDFKLEETSIQETVVHRKHNSSHFYSLNDVVIRDKKLKTTHLTLKVNDNLLEEFVGDGILISTSVGSTAYNLSFGGSIVYGMLHTLQITPIAPLNSKAYRTLQNSVIIPEDRVITIVPKETNKNLLLTIDGENNSYKNVEQIVTRVGDKKIYCLRMNEYDYTNIIHDKFVK